MKIKKLFLGFVLAFHASIYHSVAQTPTTQVEAESGTLVGVSTATSGGVTYVTGFDKETDQFSVQVTVPSKNFYKVVISYRSTSGDKTQFIDINNGGASPVVFPQTASFTDLNAGKYLLNKGVNTITVKNSWGYVDFDKFTLYTAEKNTYNITQNLVDPNANEATKSLYSFLLNNFGKKIISGQTSDNYDEIKTITQNAPMLRAFDFQHYTQGYPYLWKDGGHSFGYEDDGTVNKAIEWYNSTDKRGMKI